MQAEINYYTTLKEMLIVTKGCDSFARMCWASMCSAVGSCSLKMVLAGPEFRGQHPRWLHFLGDFDFEIAYRPEARHKNPNVLSSRSCRTCVL